MSGKTWVYKSKLVRILKKIETLQTQIKNDEVRLFLVSAAKEVQEALNVRTSRSHLSEELELRILRMLLGGEKQLYIAQELKVALRTVQHIRKKYTLVWHHRQAA